jgi:enamine deaminase RidA (YjgF/YER057c/UK114 family)
MPDHRYGAALALALLVSAAGPARAEEPKLAISGYDSVAYFTESKPVAGQKDLEYVWHNLRWRFSKAAHRDMFASNPDRYAPQYDGYCAVGVTGVDFAAPHKDTVDPEAWTIIDGKLYLAHTRESPLWDEWRGKGAESVKKADEAWKYVKNQTDPVIVGAPCRETTPPTVIITTSDGKRELLLAGQAALDKEGKIIGKGDMRAQLEQVGKNIDACLAAAGATKANIFRTHTTVTSKEAFLKHADLWSQYLGPVRPVDAAVEEKPLNPPDLLVKIAAVALLN